MSRFLRKKILGFTLIELLVVIVIIAVLAMIIVPVVGRAIRSARRTVTLKNGQELYKLLVAGIELSDQPGVYTPSPVTWPKSKPNPQNGEKAFTCSTEFFADMIASNVLEDISWTFFAEDKIRKAPSDAIFRESDELHNAWCLTLDANKLKGGSPVLFTQNFKFKNPGTGARINEMDDGLVGDAYPYGELGGIVVSRGGGGSILDKDAVIMTNFCPTASSNMFLWPLQSGQKLETQ